MAVVERPAILLYTRLRRTPYFHSSRRHGVHVYSVYNHFYHPRHYGDPVEEYWHLLNEVTMWDVGVERQIEISGPDAFTFTNMLVPRDLNKCKVGQCKYVFITAPDGGIINDPVLLRTDENVFRLSLADSDVDLWAMGLAHNSGLDVSIREVDNNPYEVVLGYGWMVDLEQKADFVGKEALKRIKAQGVTQKLVGVDIEGDSLGSYIDNEMIDYFPVYADGRQIGRVTSACHSPR